MKIKFLNVYNEEELFQTIKLEKNIFSPSHFNAKDIYSFTENKYINIVCCLEGDEVIAYLIFSDNVDCFEILRIACKQEFQRKGAATLLLREMFKLKKDIFLEVRKSNEKAINFYRKNSFNYISTRKNYYFDGEDALIFKRDGGTDE